MISNQLNDVIRFLIGIEERLRASGGGQFCVRLHPAGSHSLHIDVCAPELAVFELAQSDFRQGKSLPISPRTIDWHAELSAIVRRSCFGQIEVELKKSGQRMVTEWKVTSSHRQLG